MDRRDEASSCFLMFGKQAKKANYQMAANKLPVKITFIRMHIS